MKKKRENFLSDLMAAPSPSGYEQPAQDVFRKFVAPFADEIKTDFHGNVIASKKGTGSKRIMLVGHADEIGFMVKYIDDDGFIRFSPIGFIDHTLLPNHKVNIYHEGKVVRGVIGVKPPFLYKHWERDQVITLDDLWIDIGAANKADAEKRVSVGDHITFLPGMEKLPNQLIVSKAADNKVGVFAVASVLSNLAKEKLSANIFAVSTVQEEIGARGVITSSFGIEPHIGIVVDVTPAIDHPTLDKNTFGDIRLNHGVTIALGANINPRVLELLKKAAKETKTKYQPEPIAGTSMTDALTLQVTRAGVATGLLSIPIRYVHSPSEMVSLSDLEGAVTLLTRFCKIVDDETGLIP